MMSNYYTEETKLEISKVRFDTIVWKNDEYEPALSMNWTEQMPPPYTDDDVSIDISKDEAAELVKILTEHFKL